MRAAITFPGCNRTGGVERVAFECARFLATRGHQVVVFADQYEREKNGSIEYRDVPLRKWPAFARPDQFFRKCSRQFAEESARQPFDVLASFGCVCPVGGVYWAQSVHAAWVDHRRRLRSPLSIKRWKQTLNPIHHRLLQMEKIHLAERRYRKVIALSDEVQRDLYRYYGVPAEDVTVIPNGFSPKEFNLGRREELRKEMRATLGYKEADKVVMFAANELDRKGFGPLLRALAEMKDANVKLLVVGRVKAGAYAAEIAARRWGDRVYFAGATSEIMRFYAAADLFALPTQYEAWGMVIVEAMACGLPVLTSRLAGAAVAVAPGVGGLLLDDPQDVPEISRKLRQILAGAAAPAERIAQSVQAYSWENVLLAYERVLQESIAPGASVRA